jgi:hypothetical protein
LQTVRDSTGAAILLAIPLLLVDGRTQAFCRSVSITATLTSRTAPECASCMLPEDAEPHEFAYVHPWPNRKSVQAMSIDRLHEDD